MLRGQVISKRLNAAQMPSTEYESVAFIIREGDQSIFQLQESMAREWQKKLTKATEEFTIQVQSLKEKVSGLISEKVKQTSLS